ncbi:mediator complex subunit, partial [Rhizopus stolonifer]
MDISLNEAQKQHVRVNAQKQLVPPEENGLLFFPLVNMYDYLHLCCLNMQLEILYIQAAMLAKTRWINQLKVQMNQERTKLTLVYWRGGSPASRWASQSHSNKNTTIEISIRDADPFALSMSMRDDWKGLIQKAGIGASIRLSEMPVQDRPKVLASLKYPKHMLEVLWDGRPELYTDQPLLNPSHLNVEQLVLHATNHHGQCMINQFRSLLVSQKDFLQENGLYLAEESSLVIRYRHAKYISIESDARTGRVKAFEASDGCHEGDFKLRSLEDKLNNDPEHIARHLLWLRSEVVVREVISLAKQLNLQPYHPSHMNLRPEDIQKLFGDLTEAKQVNYPSHCIFLQFSQFEDCTTNAFLLLIQSSKTYDASGLYQTIVDLTYLECDQLWQDQFMDTKRHKKQRLSYEQPIDRLSIDLRYLAKLDSLCQAYIMNRKIELQLQSYRLAYHTRPLLQSLTGIETHGMNHPAADKMEVVCVSQQDVLKTSSGTLDSWVQRLLPLLKNDIMIRSFGWWGQSGDCYVVVQDKLDADALHLKGHALGDHIALDRATGVVSFTYTQIDRCIEQFLVDWERLFMMANLARQVSSVWFKKYKDQLVFEATDLQSLRMTYAKHYGCTIRWDTITKGQQRQYQLDLFTHHTKQTPVTALPTQIRNPHWRIASFLRDVLNDNRDLIYFVQILFQTLPLMSCLERLEVKCIQEGDIGKVSIIPRAYDAVRVIFSSMYAIDIRFTDKSTLCLSDAAYASPFSSSTSSPPPAPYLLPSLQQKSDAISVAQQCKFIPFDQFSQLLDTLDKETFEPSVVPFQHGFLCELSKQHRHTSFYLSIVSGNLPSLA